MEDTIKQLLVDKLESLDALTSKMEKHFVWEEGYHKEFSEDLKEIKEQTQKTNGRVTALEMFKEKIIGYALGVAGLFSLIVTAFKLL